MSAVLSLRHKGHLDKRGTHCVQIMYGCSHKKYVSARSITDSKHTQHSSEVTIIFNIQTNILFLKHKALRSACLKDVFSFKYELLVSYLDNAKLVVVQSFSIAATHKLNVKN